MCIVTMLVFKIVADSEPHKLNVHIKTYNRISYKIIEYLYTTYRIRLGLNIDDMFYVLPI